MKLDSNEIELRVLDVYDLYINTDLTIRGVAADMGISKSVIHHDLSVKLKRIDIGKYSNFLKIASIKLHDGQLRGGKSTGNKYKGKKRKDC